MSKERIRFKSAGINCAADLFLPDRRQSRLPAVVLGAGFNSIREGLAGNAEYLRAAGYAALAIDYRTFGESEGEPRGQLFPLEEVEDFRNAISYLQTRDEIDADRIGLWGVSFAGGVVIQAAAFDRRVRAVVAQSPIVNGREWMRGLRTTEQWEILLQRLQAERVESYKSGVRARIPSTGVGSRGDFAAMPGDEELIRYVETRKKTPGYRPELNLESITLDSMEKVIEFMPDKVIELISPRALMVVANGAYSTYDIVHPLEQIQSAFQRAGEPKSLVLLPYRERGLYSEPGMGEAMKHAVAFFRQHIPG